MAASKYLELAVVLTAVDNMSAVFRNAVGNGAAGFNQLANSQERATAAMGQGLRLGAGAKVAIDALKDLSDKYGNVQESQQDLRIAMMKAGGMIDERTYGRDVAMAEDLSKRFAGTQMAYYDMERGMVENRLDEKDILGGVGDAVARLSELFRTLPAESAIFAARVKNDMKVPAADMEKMVDLLARLKQVGVGHTGSEAIANMTEFYSKAGLGAVNLGLSGTNDAQQLGALGAMYIAKGNDAPSVGTTFRKIFDNIAMPKKMKEMNEEAAKFGKHLEFFDKAGHFKGVQNFVAQLGTLKGLDTSAISEILGPGGSKQGMSADVLKNIALFGETDYLDFLKRISDQATLEQKVAELQKATNQQRRIAASDIENLGAQIGKSYNPVIDMAIRLTGQFANVLGTFVKAHQTITGIAAGLVGVAGAAMAVGSAFRFMQAAWLYARMPVLVGQISSVFSGLAGMAESFAVVLLRNVLPALTEIQTVILAIAETITALGAGTTAALAAPLAYLGYKMYSEHQKDVAARADYERQDDAYNRAHPDGVLYSGVDKQVMADWVNSRGRAINPASHPLKNLPALHPDITNELLGDMKKRSAPAAPTVVYSPTINMPAGAAPDHLRTLKDLLKEHTAHIERMLDKKHHDALRTAY